MLKIAYEVTIDQSEASNVAISSWIFMRISYKRVAEIWFWHSGFGGQRINMGNLDEKRPHICTICNKSFVKPAHLHEHLQRVHEKVKYPCRTCKKTFSSASYRDKHEKKCEGNKYTCRECGQEFAELVKLHTHRYVQCFKCLNNALTFLFFMPCFCRDFLNHLF